MTWSLKEEQAPWARVCGGLESCGRVPHGASASSSRCGLPLKLRAAAPRPGQVGPGPGCSAQRQRPCLKPQRGNGGGREGLPDSLVFGSGLIPRGPPRGPGREERPAVHTRGPLPCPCSLGPDCSATVKGKIQELSGLPVCPVKCFEFQK